MEFILAGQWQQACKAVGHDGAVVKKQREMYAGAQLTLQFMHSATPAHGIVLPTFRVGLPTSINLIIPH